MHGPGSLTTAYFNTKTNNSMEYRYRCLLLELLSQPKDVNLVRSCEQVIYYLWRINLTITLGFFCETWRYLTAWGGVLLNQEGFLDPTGLEGSLASSYPRDFFECNTMVGIYLSSNVGMIFNQLNSCCMSYFWCIIKLILHKFIYNMYVTQHI